MKPKYKRPIVQIRSKFWTFFSLGMLILFALSSLYLSGCAPISVKPDTASSETKWSAEYEDILWFAVKRMELHKSDLLFKKIGSERPSIHITSIENVQEEFAKRSQKFFEKFRKKERSAGRTHEKITKELEMYVGSVGAFFHSPTNDIYIGVNGHISRCRLKARIAHEVAHFLQAMVYGVLPRESSRAIYESLMRREMKALGVESGFGKQHCPEEVKSWEIHL